MHTDSKNSQEFLGKIYQLKKNIALSVEKKMFLH